MILICFGTRPEWIKIKPILNKINGRIPFKIVCTGQHTNIIDASAKNYDIQYLEINTSNSGNRLDDIVTSILTASKTLFGGVTSVLVQGDTTSAFAFALAALHRRIPIIHLEAGLRSFDKNNPYPEEFNRRSISAMADIHLCPTIENKNNLDNEKVDGQKYVVGNTVLDNLRDIQPTLENYVLITMHRRENLSIIDKWFSVFDLLALKNTSLKFILPIHPNPEIQKHKHILQNVQIIQPLQHEDCTKLIGKCSMIITDSGGIQEEASFLKKKCIVCRKTTERQEGTNVFSTLCCHPDELEDIFNNTKIKLVDAKCPYGDGNSADRIFKILTELYVEK